MRWTACGSTNGNYSRSKKYGPTSRKPGWGFAGDLEANACLSAEMGQAGG